LHTITPARHAVIARFEDAVFWSTAVVELRAGRGKITK
jgi:hypothetical protein